MKPVEIAQELPPVEEPPARPLPEDNWQHGSAKMKCRTCMYFVGKSNRLGRCRRRAPTSSGWPAVYETDWCGEHKLDERKA